MSLLPYVQPGNAITLTVPFVDSNGGAILGSQIASLAYGVFDSYGDDLIGLTTFPVTVPYSTEALPVSASGYNIGSQLDDDVVVNYNTPTEPQQSTGQAMTALPSPAATDTGVSVTVSANFNVLTAPYPDPDYAIKTDIATEDVREVRVLATLSTGAVVTLNAYYRIVLSSQELVIVQNSFQTFAQAMLVADRMPDLKGFLTANKAQRLQGLKEAYSRLIRFGYYVRWPRDPDAQNYLDWFENRNAVIIPRLWVAMTQDRWFQFYPEVFREAMRRAQVYEADDILTIDPYETKRDNGVVSEKVGDASITFLKPKTAVESIGLSANTLRVLKGYINFRLTLGRL